MDRKTRGYLEIGGGERDEVTYLLDGAGRTVLLEPGKDQKADGVLFRMEWRELHARSR